MPAFGFSGSQVLLAQSNGGPITGPGSSQANVAPIPSSTSLFDPNAVYFKSLGCGSSSIVTVRGCNHVSNIEINVGRRLYCSAISSLLSVKGYTPLHSKHGKDQSPSYEDFNEDKWNASPSLSDQKLCAWLGLCAYIPQSGDGKETSGDSSSPGSNEYWTSGTEDPDTWSDEERRLRTIPDYVLEFAPYVHLYSGEQFWPCDIADHIIHTTPFLNFTPIKSRDDHPKLTDLANLNRWGGDVFLQSDENVESRPDWLGGKVNIPSSPEDEEDEDDQGGRSDAPVVMFTMDKGDGIVDAFWFYFYSYNLGPTVFNIRFGNHVGDWEHMVVRFKHGKPEGVFLSEHSGGVGYTYEAIEKIGQRPVGYSALGTHAMYATPGVHKYGLPFALHDVTDRGPLWDPLLNLHAYTLDFKHDKLRSSTLTPKSPTNWYHFLGHWGDKRYPMRDKRQYTVAGQYHYVNGPQGPRYKNLDRKTICYVDEDCIVMPFLQDIFLPGTQIDDDNNRD